MSGDQVRHFDERNDADDVRSINGPLLLGRRDGVMTAEDPRGGIWWPSEEAQAEIEAAEDPAARCAEICRTAPMRGEWAN